MNTFRKQYIFLDADDALEAHAVRSVRPLFGAGVAKVHFRMALVDEGGNALGGTLPSTLATGEVRRDLVADGMLYPSPPGSGNAYRRSVLERLFPLPVDAADRVGADFFAIYGAVAFGAVAACDRPLARYRLHRRARVAGDELVFGNAALGNDEAAKVVSRYARLRALVAERTGGAVVYAPRLLDFSVQKSSFAAAVLGRSWLRGLFASGDVLRPLLKSIWLQPAFRPAKRLGLTAWALLLLVAPRRTAFRLARYDCNPASRAA